MPTLTNEQIAESGNKAIHEALEINKDDPAAAMQHLMQWLVQMIKDDNVVVITPGETPRD